MKNEKTFPKTNRASSEIRPAKGSVQAVFKRCGKENCRCASRQPEDFHGPYFYRYYRVEGQLRREYIPRCDAETVKAACDRARKERAAAREIRGKAWKAYKRMNQSLSQQDRILQRLRQWTR